jgi:hypothetical protein
LAPAKNILDFDSTVTHYKTVYSLVSHSQRRFVEYSVHWIQRLLTQKTAKGKVGSNMHRNLNFECHTFWQKKRPEG